MRHRAVRSVHPATRRRRTDAEPEEHRVRQDKLGERLCVGGADDTGPHEDGAERRGESGSHELFEHWAQRHARHLRDQDQGEHQLRIWQAGALRAAPVLELWRQVRDKVAPAVHGAARQVN